MEYIFFFKSWKINLRWEDAFYQKEWVKVNLNWVIFILYFKEWKQFYTVQTISYISTFNYIQWVVHWVKHESYIELLSFFIFKSENNFIHLKQFHTFQQTISNNFLQFHFSYNCLSLLTMPHAMIYNLLLYDFVYTTTQH